jgi:hypothetical protein
VGDPIPSLDPEVKPLRLSAVDKRQLLAFLGTLSGDVHEGGR